MLVKKKIVVTGASSGIGLATVKKLVDKGFQVVATARNELKLEECFSSFVSKGDVVTIAWDLSDISSIKEYSKVVKEQVGELSGLVHCAGTQKISPVHMINEKKLLEVFNINTFAAISLVSAFSKKGMFDSDGTSFVLISSISAHSGVSGNTIYASSKGAIEGFVSGAASELAEKNIRINSVVPGRVLTPMVESFMDTLSEVDVQKAKDEYPLGWGTPESIADFIGMLISEESKWLTGQNYILDGGHLVRTSH